MSRRREVAKYASGVLREAERFRLVNIISGTRFFIRVDSARNRKKQVPHG
jgi:hypothetical protein